MTPFLGNGPILVTGHTGFKGAWLVLLLRSFQLDVVGVSIDFQSDSLYSRIRNELDIEEVFLDIRNFRAINQVIKSRKPSIIFHLAAQPLVLESFRKPLETFQTNVMGTANILESVAGQEDVRSVIVSTTDKVYRNQSTERQAFQEDDPLGGNDPYSLSKVGTEAVVAAWQKIARVRKAKQPISAVRAGNVIGGGDYAKDRLMPDLIRGFLNKEPIEIRNPQSTRPWQHVLDPLMGYLKTAEHNITAEHPIDAINFGPLTTQNISVKEVIEESVKIWGVSPIIDFLPRDNDYLETSHLALDSTLARSKLGWVPQFSQKEAVRRTITWWKRLSSKDCSAYELCVEEIEEIKRLCGKRKRL